jgi:type II secretory ATPase GspE/PulE/Tfp pilus assembly ATPase PilB-like protein
MTDLRTMVQFVNREEEERTAQALAERLKLAYMNLVDYPFTPAILQLLPEASVEQFYVIPYLRTGNQLKVATPRPEDVEMQSFLADFAKTNNLTIEIAVCSYSSFRFAAQALKITEEPKITPNTPTSVSAQLRGFTDKAALAARLKSVSTSEALDILFAGALALRATDIHIEPTEQALTIRFRVDGVLQLIAEEETTLYRSLRSRIKYLAGMKLDIVSEAQDGRFEVRSLDQKLDVRVSALPTPFGETFVMRLLTGGTLITLEDLGFSTEQIGIIRTAASKPNGLILNTGPTGSGKSTTLYAILSELNKPGVKIITIEDPIEYRLKGVQQTQIDPDKNYTFASALRSVLRQDPDIIMVGEIRDAETATIAVQAALTGHLVLSTLHTNSAGGSIPRLLDMGVKTYLLGGVINLIIAQRLVRKLAHPELSDDARYEGRVAIAELLVPNHEIETLIQQKGTTDQFEVAAKANGMVSLYEDGETKVKVGITTEEELRRVATQDELDEASTPAPTPDKI